MRLANRPRERRYRLATAKVNGLVNTVNPKKRVLAFPWPAHMPPRLPSEVDGVNHKKKDSDRQPVWRLSREQSQRQVNGVDSKKER